MPATVMPMTSQIRLMVRDHNEMEGPFGDGQIATGTQILLACGVRLHRADDYPEKIAHNTKATAVPIARTTMMTSNGVLFCSRNGLKPIRER